MKQRIAGWLAPLLILMAGLAIGFIIGKDRGMATIGQAPQEYSNMIAQADGSVILATEPSMNGKSWSHEVDSTGALLRQIEVVVQPQADSAEYNRILKSRQLRSPSSVSVHLSLVLKRNGTTSIVASSEHGEVLYGRQFTGFLKSAEKRKWADLFSFAGFTSQPIVRTDCRSKPYATSAGRSAATRTAGSGAGAVART